MTEGGTIMYSLSQCETIKSEALYAYSLVWGH